MRKPEVLGGARESVQGVLLAAGFTTLEVAMRTGLSHRAAFGALLELERDGLVGRSGSPGDWSWRLEAGSSSTDESHHLRSLFDHIPVVTYHYPVPYSSSEYYISPQVEALLGYPREAWSRPSFWESLLHPEDGDVARSSEHSISTGTPFTAQYRVRAQDGRWIWIQDEATLATSPPSGRTYWLGVWVDITSFRTTEEELTRSIRALNDLNDERLSQIAHLVASRGNEHPGVRNHAHGDHPSELERVGLGTAIELYGKSFGESAAIDVQVENFLDGDVSPWVAGPIFLIASEALSGVLVRSGPHTARVRLERLGGGVLITIDDDGAELEAGESLDDADQRGLRAVRESAESHGGWLRTVRGTSGARVESWIPG